MAITQAELDRVRGELEAKIAGVSLEHVNMAQAIGSYGERFTAVDARFDAVDFRIDALAADMDRRFDEVDRRFSAVDRQFDSLANEMGRRFTDVRGDLGRLDARIDRLDSKLDARFNVQTVLMTVLGVLVLFGDPIRSVLGL